MTKRRLPFDLIPSQFHRIEVLPEVYAAMHEEDGLTQKALSLIEDHWQIAAEKADQAPDDLFFGLTIPLRHGITAAEERALDQTIDLQKKALATSNELAANIAEKLGKTAKEALDLLRSSSTTIADELMPFAAEIIDSNQQFQEIDYGIKIATVLIRRAIPAWTDELSAVLHPSIMTGLAELDLIEREHSGKVPKRPSQSQG